MNNYDNFFNNLLPLQPLLPFVQSVLPTVFDNSLSYLETLGKVVKALNDTESNVNTLEQAVRAFADDLALYENLTISPVEITFSQETGTFSASMTYADIVSAIEEGHTMVMHVVDGLHHNEYYSATMKVTETSGGVKVIYWESPAFTVNGATVFYEPFINEYDTAGVVPRTITGSGSDTFIIHYDSDTETADKTFAKIVAAIEAEKTVMLIADHFFISNARWTTSGNDEIGYEVISVQFNAFNVVTQPSGKSLGCVTYAVDDANTWTVTHNGFPNETRVNALIDVKLAQLEGLDITCVVNATVNPMTSSISFSDLHDIIAVQKQAVNFLIVDAYNNYYQTSLAYVDDSKIVAIFILDRANSSTPYPVLYATITSSGVTLGTDNISTGSGLPAVTAADNGKFLRVVSGAWAAASVPDAESTSFGP